MGWQVQHPGSYPYADTAPSSAIQTAKEWLKEHDKEPKVFNCPPVSQDPN